MHFLLFLLFLRFLFLFQNCVFSYGSGFLLANLVVSLLSLPFCFAAFDNLFIVLYIMPFLYLMFIPILVFNSTKPIRLMSHRPGNKEHMPRKEVPYEITCFQYITGPNLTPLVSKLALWALFLIRWMYRRAEFTFLLSRDIQRYCTL
jgi:hypothetical protein